MPLPAMAPSPPLAPVMVPPVPLVEPASQRPPAPVTVNPPVPVLTITIPFGAPEVLMASNVSPLLVTFCTLRPVPPAVVVM